MVVVKIVDKGFFGLEGISDVVFVGFEVCGCKIIIFIFKFILEI